MSIGNIIRLQHYPLPYGELLLGSFEDKLCLCDWNLPSRRRSMDWKLQRGLYAFFEENPSEVTRKAARMLDEYFAGERTAFDLPLLLVGTDFQRSVWQALQSVAYGEVTSYQELAAAIHRPKAVRAVGNALHVNPVSIFVPCHRVLGANKNFVGYAGGRAMHGLLLEVEKGRCDFFI
ncbi:MAG: methylated-DNA--[protein]-cysteine S-methyltransferase [Mediterranea sp.]|nr:methylated-DNA--[protein]-cysteine S-methyltransferase [Mediterranea sp.]